VWLHLTKLLQLWLQHLDCLVLLVSTLFHANLELCLNDLLVYHMQYIVDFLYFTEVGVTVMFVTGNLHFPIWQIFSIDI